MKDPLVHPRESSLGAITLILALAVWLMVIVIAWIYLLIGFVFYCFAQSALISWLRGNGVLVSASQLPDLRSRYEACCTRLGIEEPPELYLLQGGGMLNAFATRFLGRHYVVLLSDIVDAMDPHPDGVGFYMGHELGHVRMGHLTGGVWRIPVLWLPLLGAAYSRAKESTCDRHGRACCETPESAARAMLALAAGQRRWQQVDLPAYAAQAELSRGFWMSFHELVGGYPWLTKRTVRVLDPEAAVPKRHPLAWLLALFVPYTGRAGGGAGGVLVLVAIIGILAAVALPAYQDYTVRARLSSAYLGSADAREHLGEWYVKHDREAPSSLQDVGIAPTLADGSTLTLDAEQMVLSIETVSGQQLLLVPDDLKAAKLSWSCFGGEGVKRSQLPSGCQELATPAK